jgi:transposase
LADRGASAQSLPPAPSPSAVSVFAGSDEGAHHRAVPVTLVENWKLNGVNPTAYLTDVLTRLVNSHLQSRLGELTPWS